MAQGSINRYRLLTDDTSDSSLFEVGGVPVIARLYPDRVSYSVWAAHFSSTRQVHAVDPFESNPVAVYCIGRCTSNGHINF